MGRYSIDDSQFPLVVVHFDGVLDDDGFQRYLGDYRRILAKNQKYAVLFDATAAGRPSAAQRRWQADFILENEPTLQRLCIAGAFAISSPVVRGAMTAILWISPMPFPYEIRPDVASARAWLEDRMRADGLR